MAKYRKPFLVYRLLRRYLIRKNFLVARFFKSTEAGTLNYRRLLLIFSDVFLVSVSIIAAFLFRFDFDIPQHYIEQLKDTLAIGVVARVVIFYFFRIYKGMWRYAGLQDLISILKAVSIGSVALAVISYNTKGFFYPRSVLIIDWMLCVILIGGERPLSR